MDSDAPGSMSQQTAQNLIDFAQERVTAYVRLSSDTHRDDTFNVNPIVANFFSIILSVGRSLVAFPEMFRDEYGDLVQEYYHLLSDGDTRPERITSVRMLEILSVLERMAVIAPSYSIDLENDIGVVRAEIGGALEVAAQLSTIEMQQRVEQLEKQAEKAASQIGAQTLGVDFNSAYRQEWQLANVFRYLTFVSLAVAAVIAIFVLKNVSNFTWQTEVARLSLAVPFLGAAYFTSFEARDHRRFARKERGWQARINTLEIFCAPLDEQQRNEVRMHFAKALFSDPPDFGSSETLADANQRVIDQAVAIVQAVRPAKNE